MNKILEKTAVKANDYFNLPLPARLYIDSVIKKKLHQQMKIIFQQKS